MFFGLQGEATKEVTPMANAKNKKSGGAASGRRRQALARPGQEGPACPDGLNVPRPSRDDYIAGVLEQIAEFEERLGELESDLEAAGWEDPGDYTNQIEDLRVQLKAAREKAGEVEGATDAAWPSVYDEMEETLLEVTGRMENLAAELGRVLPPE